MWRDVSIILTFTLLRASAFPNTLLELCRSDINSTECDEMSLDCQNTLIVHLESSMVPMNPKLQCLSLSNTQLTSIEEGAFDGLTSLKYLDIQGNLLTQLDNEVFSKLTRLEYLDLSNNSLTSLTDERLFMSLENLKVLKLSSNKISHVDVKVLIPLKSLTTLSLSDNPFHCDCQVLEILALCRKRRLNTTVICEEPEELEGLSWEVLVCDVRNEQVGLLKSDLGKNHLEPKYLKASNVDSLVGTVFLISLTAIIMLILCASIGMVFYSRKKKNKVEPQVQNSVRFEAGTSHIHFEQTKISTDHHLATDTVDFTINNSCLRLKEVNEESNLSDVFKENPTDTEVLVRSNDRQKRVRSARYSGDYDNVDPKLRF